MEIANESDLIRRIQAHRPEDGSFLVAVDGVPGAGKSTLAHAIGAQIGGTVIHIDDYVPKRAGRYCPNLKVDQLAADVIALKAQRRPVVLEGLCLLEVLARVDVSPDLFVYVKRVDADGDWLASDELLCDTDREMQEVLAYIGRCEGSKRGIGDLDREIAQYHRNHFPLQRAAYVFLREE